MSKTLSQLKTYAQHNGWLDSSADGLTALTDFINDTIDQLDAEYRWPMRRKIHAFALKAPYSTGTVGVTNGSATVTTSGADISDDMAGQEFLGPDGRVYRISSVSSDSSQETLTLAQAYVGATNASGTYAVRYVAYDLPSDFGQPGAMVLEDERDVNLDYSLEEWLSDRMAHTGTTSSPSDAVIIRGDDAGIYVHPAPSEAKQVQMTYYRKATRMTADSDTADWPDRLLFLLHGALRIRLAHDLADVGAIAVMSREFQGLLKRAFEHERPYRGPIDVGVRRPGVVSVERLKASVNIVSD